jgi:Flp pilus assembly protein CpaB
VTLLVRLDDAERLVLATKEGHVQLVLRNPVDTHADKVKEATIHQLYEVSPAPRVKTIKPRRPFIAVGLACEGVRAYANRQPLNKS